MISERKYNALEKKLADALEAEANKIPVEVSASAIDNIMKKSEEVNIMNRRNYKKIAIVAAAVCIIGSFSVYAASKITSYTSHSSHNDEITDFSKLSEITDELDFNINVPESFTNGYEFESAVPRYTEAMDDSNTIVAERTELGVTYGKAGESSISLSAANKIQGEEPDAGDETFDLNGITLSYSMDEYMFVPPDFEMTEDIQKRVDAGELFVSYGSSEVESNVVKSISWEDDGIRYIMLSFDNSMDSEGFKQMAEEVINAN